MQICTPDWVKNAVFYQIFPDRFVRSSQPHPIFGSAPLEPWHDPPTPQGYKGGDLWGVIEQLDYVQELGINAIYFTPIFQSTSNHRYHTHDYYQVDPLLGGNAALESLLESAHQRGMRVVLDGVFNHASRGFFFFNDILENGPHSPWLDWFQIEGWPLSAYDGSKPANYVGWANNRALPQFNHANLAVREYLMQVAEYWIKLGVDGWRLDVPNEIRVPGFWQEFRDRVKAINPDAYIVGEIWEDARHWLDGTQFDGVMNYLFTGPTIAFVAGDRVDRAEVRDRSYTTYPALSAEDYAAKMEALLTLYPWEIQLAQLNLLDSHDTARLLTIAQGDAASVELATLLLFTFPGAPSVYYGDEIGLPGALDPDSRRGFPPQTHWNQDVLTYHKQLIALRHAHPALRTGHYRVLYAKGAVYAFARTLESETRIVAVNSSTEPVQFSLNLPEDLAGLEDLKGDTRSAQASHRLLYGTAEVTWQDHTLSLTLPARQGVIL